MRRVVLVAVVLLACLSLAAAVSAQAGLRWSQVEQVWGYEDEADTPFLVSDRNKTVHALNSRTVDRGVIDITYRRWTLDQGWTEPVDIMLSPEKNIARLRGVAVDNDSTLHMVFYGGDEQGASIYYTSAPTPLADTARGWSAPILIGDDAGPVNDAAMISDGQEKLFVVYTGSRDGMGVYAIFSLDGGLNWSEPENVFQSARGQFPTNYSMELDNEGRLHVSWAEADLTGNGQLIYYTRLDELQSSWTTPVVLERRTAEDYEVDWPALVSQDGELLLVYQDSTPASKFMRRSGDGGVTWSAARRVFPGYIGENGRVEYAKDSAGGLHVLLGNRTESNTIHGMWHATWQNDGWGQLRPVASGARVVAPLGADGFDPNRPKATVVQGNLLLVAWVTDPGAGPNGVFYSYTFLGTPELPRVLPPETAPTAAPFSITPTNIPDTPTPLPPTLAESQPLVRENSYLSTALLIGALPVIALIGLIALVQMRRNK